ncbi:MAG: helix-turn-helix domain-containing protein [Pseudonocardiaceae bacterium]
MLRYRVEHLLSQAEQGAKLGVSQPYVARLESGGVIGQSVGQAARSRSGHRGVRHQFP